MKSYVIHFVRHGLTTENVQKKYTGQMDVHLSEEGVKNLETLRDKYDYPRGKLYFCSPLIRCKETLKILYNEDNFTTVDGLKECSFGDWEDKSMADLVNDETFKKWIKGDNDISPPNGESNNQFTSRIFNAFEKLVEDMMKKGDTSAVIVTHGGVILMLLSRYGIPKAEAHEWLVDNGCGYSIRITPGLWMRDKVFEIYDRIPKSYESDYDPEENYNNYFNLETDLSK